MVERVTRLPAGDLPEGRRGARRNSGREQTTAWCYAVGWTHHTTGVQMIRAAAHHPDAARQHRPARRRHPRTARPFQHPGQHRHPDALQHAARYLPQPSARKPHKTLRRVPRDARPPTGWWHNFPKYVVSLLRAWYGDSRDARQRVGLPVDAEDRRRPLPAADDAGDPDRMIRGLFSDRPEPGDRRPQQHLIREALPNLEWMVVRETFENETASYWYQVAGSRERRAAGRRTSRPRCSCCRPRCLARRRARFTNTHRLIQWHDKVVEPPGDCRSDTVVLLPSRPAAEGAVRGQHRPEGRADPESDLGLPGPAARMQSPRPKRSCKEINGYTWPEREADRGLQGPEGRRHHRLRLLDLHRRLPARTTTTRPAPASRTDPTGRAPTWAGDSPGRATGASCTTAPPPTPTASPGPSAKVHVWWDGAEQQDAGSGHDKPDFAPTSRPTTSRTGRKQPQAAWTRIDGTIAVHDDRRRQSWLFVPSGLKDGPLPTHYEPVESPVQQPDVHAAG